MACGASQINLLEIGAEKLVEKPGKSDYLFDRPSIDKITL